MNAKNSTSIKSGMLRVALAQINVSVGDLPGNTKKIIDSIQWARSCAADVIVLPELALTGYPPEDLLLRPQFVADNQLYLAKIIPTTRDIIAVVGFVEQIESKLYNAAAIVQNQNFIFSYHKAALPNYGVFDEERYFEPGLGAPIASIGCAGIAVNICEDIWVENSVAQTQALAGNAKVLINISASPFHAGKEHMRDELLARLSWQNRAFFVYVNLVGGQDELVFDGGSAIYDPFGKSLFAGALFSEQLSCWDLDLAMVERARAKDSDWQKLKAGHRSRFQLQLLELSPIIERPKNPPAPVPNRPETSAEAVIYQALVLGLQDYVHKNGFNKVVLGLSGGIDSAMVAAVAVDALGSENVVTVTMPSRYSSAGSVSDSELLAHNLNIRLLNIAIEPAFVVFKNMLADVFQNQPEDITEENLQARIRANLLMALSNKFNWLVLTTGNKSEISVGYCTIYGDMAGGFSVLKDVPKTLVYRLAEYRNQKAGYDLIPYAIIDKVPSAELRPNQTDQDSLPPYEVLDQIIEAYIQNEKSVAEIIAGGFDPALVHKIIRLIDSSEYKRRQAAPGVKITPRAFGKDRRMPITNRYIFAESSRFRVDESKNSA